MDEDRARFILRSFRPDGADVDDHDFAEALAMAMEHRELGEWLAEERAFDGAFAKALCSVELPENLRDDIFGCLAGERADFPQAQDGHDAALTGIVLLEAAAMKLAIVATNVPGCVDAVQDGVTGTLIPPYDSRQLVAAVRRYLRDPELSHRHGEAARARVLRDFSDRAMWKAVYEEYVALLENQGIPVPDTSAPATVADTPEKIGVRSHRLAKTSS